MLPILGLGFVIGLSHALEADHLAAVATIASRQGRASDIVRHGLTWGLGHTLTLLALAGVAFLLGSAIPASLAQVLELAVGAMLVSLGAHVLWRLWRARVQVDLPHAGEGFRWRTLLVGLMHGMAGSAALLLLALAQVKDPLRGLAYILVFGLGSMVGMGILSALIAVPLTLSARFISWANRGLQLGIGLCTVCLGVATLLAHLS